MTTSLWEKKPPQTATQGQKPPIPNPIEYRLNVVLSLFSFFSLVFFFSWLLLLCFTYRRSKLLSSLVLCRRFLCPRKTSEFGLRGIDRQRTNWGMPLFLHLQPRANLDDFHFSFVPRSGDHQYPLRLFFCFLSVDYSVWLEITSGFFRLWFYQVRFFFVLLLFIIAHAVLCPLQFCSVYVNSLKFVALHSIASFG